MLTFGSLFAGIGGMDLGLERSGMVCRWQVEIDGYCRRVLAKHWPDVARYGDIRRVSGEGLERVDLICGGFPCQDISQAGRGAGIDGERSGLWAEYIRLVRVLRPRYVLVENVAALLGRGIDRVLGDLAASGYDAEWDCIPAAAVGAPHRRDRLFIVAYAQRGGGEAGAERGRWQAGTNTGGCGAWTDVADAVSQRRGAGGQRPGGETLALAGGAALADANRLRQPQPAGRVGEQRRRAFDGGQGFGDGSWWVVEPPVGRVAHGIPRRVDRLRGLGNAVVPQVAEWIGRRILSVESQP